MDRMPAPFRYARSASLIAIIATSSLHTTARGEDFEILWEFDAKG